MCRNLFGGFKFGFLVRLSGGCLCRFFFFFLERAEIGGKCCHLLVVEVFGDIDHGGVVALAGFIIFEGLDKAFDIPTDNRRDAFICTRGGMTGGAFAAEIFAIVADIISIAIFAKAPHAVSAIIDFRGSDFI